MTITRRESLQLGLAGLASFGATAVLPASLRAEETKDGDSYKTDHGMISIAPIQHASFVMRVPGLVIYNDPVGGAAAYKGHPEPDLILITHQHPDHYDPETLAGLVGEKTRLITNPAVFGMLPEDLRARAKAPANGESTSIADIQIDAVPAYNMTEDRLKYHPKGRDNGYVISVDGRRVYIAGDTEDTPEMRAMKDIYIAFVPMNLPFTMTTDQAASAVEAFKPAFVYPYHYKGTDPEDFAKKVKASGVRTQVVLGTWYS